MPGNAAPTLETDRHVRSGVGEAHACPTPGAEQRGQQVEQEMRRAIALSRAVLGTTSPNPPVGAVALDEHGAVIGEGATQPPGGPHAERVALAQAGGRAHTVVTTLEPCNHTGRTGPCAQALIDAGVQRVVVGVDDPTGLAGGGNQALEAAGVRVDHVLSDEVADGPLSGWLHLQRTGRPQVVWKLATTLDGRSAAADGTSRWITGEAARADVHVLRSQVDAVLVGSGTVLEDDPLLTTRPDPGHQPLKVVLDRRSRVPATAKALEGNAVHVTGDVDLDNVLKDLADRGVVRVLLEGGPTLAAAFWQAGLVDLVVTYVAPTLLGAGASAVADLGIGTMADAARLHLIDVTRIGDDVRLTMRSR
jgi:diaminohydroxyphosphoribosylaminopyrimidine deaminase/5-amino-6-(5-phosphoribosylamino)uracil reductase